MKPMLNPAWAAAIELAIAVALIMVLPPLTWYQLLSIVVAVWAFKLVAVAQRNYEIIRRLAQFAGK